MKNLVNNTDMVGNQSLLKGRIVFEPEYKIQELDEYANNPFIEALPELFDENEVIKQFTIYPSIKEEERRKRVVARHHMIKRLKNFVQPLEIHLDIERKLSAIIRQGYLARNPFSVEYTQRLQLINHVKEEFSGKLEKLDIISETLRSTATSLSIIGISGIGKTTAMERLLLMYPQVIIHGEYQNRMLVRTQIVWLKIDCPYDGSLKTLCKIFFQAVDDVLGTTKYFEKYGNNRNSTATMMIHMTFVATIHAIGVLVIDEIQHLINSKNDSDEMLNFFVTLVNTIGVPTILVGTFKALKVLQKDFRQARRVSSEGSIIWDRMVKDDEWTFFLETMWQFQWLENFTNLTDELSDVMYDESQGITAVAVNLFILSQEKALEKGEKITISLLRDVAKNDLRMIQKMINALKNNNIEEIVKYDDISINLEEILGKIRNHTELRGKIKALSRQQQAMRESKENDLKEMLILSLSNMNIFKNFKPELLEEIIGLAVKTAGADPDITVVEREVLRIAFEKLNEKNTKVCPLNEKKNTNQLKQEDLRYVYNNAKKLKRHIYEAMEDGGYIKNPLKELYG